MVVVPIRDRSNFVKNDNSYMTPDEAIMIQQKLIKQWEPQKEVRMLRYGSMILATTASISGLIINSLFRRKLKLHSHGQVLTMVTSMFGPGLLAGHLQESCVMNDILLYKYDCSQCYEMKAALYLNGIAILFPLVTMPILNIGIAASIGLRVPYIYEVKELSIFWWSVVKPALQHITFISAINTIIAGMVTHKQILSMETIANVLLEIEEYYGNTNNVNFNV